MTEIGRVIDRGGGAGWELRQRQLVGGGNRVQRCRMRYAGRFILWHFRKEKLAEAALQGHDGVISGKVILQFLPLDENQFLKTETTLQILVLSTH